MPEREPQPAAVPSLPEPPDHLSDVGKRVWRHLAKVLSDAELLTVADLFPLEMFCDQYSEWLIALKARNETGRFIDLEKDGEVVNSYESPQSKLCRALAADCNRWFKVLGLGPAYRVGLQVNCDGADGIEDPLAASIANG